MPQAYSGPTTRRDFVRLTGAALATTTAAGTVIAEPLDTDAGAELDADAELMEVGERLIALYERETELQETLAPYSEAFDEHMCNVVCKGTDKEHRRKLYDELMQALGPEFIAATAEHTRIVEAMDEPERRMFALPARTVDGLALKAVCAAYQNSELWSAPFRDLDREECFFRGLIEAVLVFAGRPLPFATLSALSSEGSES
jgi:hypothetical protein